MKTTLRELRSARGWSQGDLADALGVSRQSVNAIETGKYDPSLPLAFRIARLFGKRIEDGQESLESLEKYMLAKGEAAPNESGRQEMLENIFNRYL